jgi:diguanylate cyclase (GGDEF)-like protein
MATASSAAPTRPVTTAGGDAPTDGALLEALRRTMRLGDSAAEPEEIHTALAHELFALLGADEVHVHHLRPDARARDGEEGEPVAVHLYGGESRLRYLVPRAERPPGVAWVASTGQPVLTVGARELAASVPRLATAAGAGCALLLPLAVRGDVEAVVILARRPPALFDTRALPWATALVDQAAAALALLRARTEAGTDAVTGCMNHRAMRRRLAEEIGRASRGGGRLSCMLLDLDDFKLVNDRLGHPAGDALLRAVAGTLQGEFRAFDRVARYGGDEFVVILPDAALESAAQAAARALARLAAIPSFEREPGVRASVGVAEWRTGMTTEELLAACDEALLRSKGAGKGRVARASD